MAMLLASCTNTPDLPENTEPTTSDNTTDKDDDVALPEKPVVNNEDLINKSDKLEIIN